jgi:hypothetical protein
VDSVKTDDNKLSLRATLHYLWEQAGFNKWYPAMSHKRNGSVIRKYLLEAANNKTTKGSSLDSILFIPENFHLMVIGTFGISASGLPTFEEMALMNVNDNWIPYENRDDLKLTHELIQANKSFIKGLRYNLPSTTPLASALVTDKGKDVTALYICPAGASDTFKQELNGLIAESNINAWLWDAGVDEMPELSN